MDFPEDAGVKFPSMFGIWVVNYIIVNAIPSDLYSHKVDKKQRFPNLFEKFFINVKEASINYTVIKVQKGLKDW